MIMMMMMVKVLDCSLRNVWSGDGTFLRKALNSTSVCYIKLYEFMSQLFA